ncbi:UdgX family uracil-DNA binding protein [Angustibacter aerolatus]
MAAAPSEGRARHPNGAAADFTWLAAAAGGSVAAMTTQARSERPDRPERPGAQEWVPPRADVDALKAAAPGCRGCELWEPATQVVFSAGNPEARIVLVGEQPGDVEDQRGIPFVGPAGQLLQRALDDAGIERRDVYVTNAVKHFRFTQSGKRRIHQTPDVGHVTACRPWVEAELTAVRPELVVVLGATAARSVIGPGVKVTQDRGRVVERELAGVPVRMMPTVHPSSVLRADAEHRQEAYDALVADLRVAAGLLA